MSSLTTIIKKLHYKQKIDEKECDELLKKLEGHDAVIRNEAILDFASWLCDDTGFDFIRKTGFGAFDDYEVTSVKEALERYLKERGPADEDRV